MFEFFAASLVSAFGISGAFTLLIMLTALLATVGMIYTLCLIINRTSDIDWRNASYALGALILLLFVYYNTALVFKDDYMHNMTKCSTENTMYDGHTIEVETCQYRGSLDQEWSAPQLRSIKPIL
jgi:cell division protein FtsW (lipid II flippase)